MAKLKPFDVVILLHPADEEERDRLMKQGVTGDAVAPNTMVVSPRELVLAQDERLAGMKAIRKIQDYYDPFLDRIEVLVRPF